MRDYRHKYVRLVLTQLDNVTLPRPSMGYQRRSWRHSRVRCEAYLAVETRLENVQCELGVYTDRRPQEHWTGFLMDGVLMLVILNNSAAD